MQANEVKKEKFAQMIQGSIADFCLFICPKQTHDRDHRTWMNYYIIVDEQINFILDKLAIYWIGLKQVSGFSLVFLTFVFSQLSVFCYAGK